MSSGSKKRLLILASGRGSNFCAIADAIQNGQIPQAEIIGLICNKQEAQALKEAQDRNIPTFLLASKTFRQADRFHREAYDQQLLALMKPLQPDLILLAGYLLILGQEIIKAFPQKIINIHPSLLPKFKGLNAQKQALESGDKETGCTVHWVNEKLDDGETILQSKVPIFPQDTVESLTQRLLPVEHATYIAALIQVLQTSK